MAEKQEKHQRTTAEKGELGVQTLSVGGSECEPPSSRAGDEGLGTRKCSGERRGVRK